MTKTSERIRYARKACGLTAGELAQLIGATEKTILRYENGQSIPDSHNLIQLACIFDLSADYLLGISDNADVSFLKPFSKRNIHYLRTQNQKIMEGCTYYWVEYDPEKEFYPMRGQMEYAGTKDGQQLYKLRPILPENAAALLKSIGRIRPLIVNDIEDFYTFLNYGGTAFIVEAVCKEGVRHLLRPGTVLGK